MAPHALSDDAPESPSIRASTFRGHTIPDMQVKPPSENTDLQAVWDESMKGVGGVGLPHRNCAVLLISWEAKLDDLNTGEEVDALEAVFQELFRYTVVKKQLVQGKQSPQIQVQKILVDFVYEYDDESTLLIVYYAGHGVPGKQEGGEGPGRIPLLLAGTRQPKSKTDPRNSVVWGEAEMIIKRTEGDVLVIFDCCHAGVLAKKTRSVSDRNFEFLAACGSDDVTDMPGENSFTSALIWALEKLAKTKSSFTTHQLLRKINEDAPRFPPHQHALLMERGEDETSCFRKLVLAPLPKPGEIDDRQLPRTKEKAESLIKHYLDLRFFYDNPPTKAEILNLSSSLKDMIASERISARHVGWLKMTDIVRNSIDQWKRRMTVGGKGPPLLAQKMVSAVQMEQVDINSPMTPPPSDFGANDSSTERSPQRSIINHVETSTVGNVESMTISNLESLNVHTENVSTAPLRRLIVGGSDYQYRPKILLVGLVVLLLECFHRLRPREAPAIVLLSFCGYAWHMSSMYHKQSPSSGSTGVSTYFPLLIGAISLFICSRLLFTDRGIST